MLLNFHSPEGADVCNDAILSCWLWKSIVPFCDGRVNTVVYFISGTQTNASF